MLLRFNHISLKISKCGFCTSLPNAQVRVRFAPSPTGMLHLGGLRTALYNFAFAKSQKGTFILRIEDTDQERVVPGATEKLEEMLKWVGIVPDEGPVQGGNYGPYFQSKRLDFYHKYLEVLLQTGSAYHCFCTEERLNLLRKEALRNREVPKYNNRCRYLNKNEVESKLAAKVPYTIRFQLESCNEPLNDLVYGTIFHDVGSLEGDPIIIKSDGYPTYHYANIVDDHLMEITHVLRGVEWQLSTTKHLLMYKAFGWKPPKYGHLPLLLNHDGTKLSKRQNDIHVDHIRQQGYFPEAVLDLISNLGGGFSSKLAAKELFSNISQLVEHFSFAEVINRSSRVEIERLPDLNRKHLKHKFKNSTDRQRLITELHSLVLKNYQKKMGNSMDQFQALSDSNLEKVLNWSVERIFVLSDLVKPEFEYLWVVPKDLQLGKWFNLNLPPDAILKKFVNILEKVPSSDFTPSALNDILKNFAVSHNLNYPLFMGLLRAAIMGPKAGPPIGELLDILGQEIALSRLKHAVTLLNQNQLIQSASKQQL